MVEEEEYNSVFSALSHPLRRNILTFIVDRGPQAYSELLTQFSLETGTLNYHLERMTAFLQQDDDGKYKATNVGYAANKLLGIAKAELSNPHAPPTRGLGVATRIRLLVHGVFDTLFLPEHAFEDAQNLSWPYLIVGLVIVAGYLFFHYLIGSNLYLFSGIITVALLTTLFILAGYGIYRHHFSMESALACYFVGFLPLTAINLLKLITDPTYSDLQYFLIFWALVWDAYIFLLAGRESFNLTLSQSFTSTALGLVVFLAVVQLVHSFQVFPQLTVP